MDHYELLRVGRGASTEEINVAARAALWAGRVDRDDARRLMYAWFILRDDGHRRHYDSSLAGVHVPDAQALLVPVPDRAPVPAAKHRPGRRTAFGPLPPERVGRPPVARGGGAPAPPAEPTPAKSPAPFDPQRLSWWHAPLDIRERIGRGHNSARFVVVVCLMLLGGACAIAGLALLPVALTTTVWTVAPLAAVAVVCLLALVAVDRRWPRAAARGAMLQRVHGKAGEALAAGRNRFTRDAVEKGVAGERLTGAALEALLRIPGTRIFHGLRFPGSRAADIDHAVANGDRVIFIDTKHWAPGQYQWSAANEIARVRGKALQRRPIHLHAVQSHPSTGKVSADVVCQVIIHPNAPGDVTFTPGLSVSPTGIPMAGAQDAVEWIGRWFLDGSKVGLVDPYLLRRLLALMK